MGEWQSLLCLFDFKLFFSGIIQRTCNNVAHLSCLSPCLIVLLFVACLYLLSCDRLNNKKKRYLRPSFPLGDACYFLNVLILTNTANFCKSKLTDKKFGTLIGTKESGVASEQPVNPQPETTASLTINLHRSADEVHVIQPSS